MQHRLRRDEAENAPFVTKGYASKADSNYLIVASTLSRQRLSFIDFGRCSRYLCFDTRCVLYYTYLRLLYLLGGVL